MVMMSEKAPVVQHQVAHLVQLCVHVIVGSARGEGLQNVVHRHAGALK